MCVSQTDFGKKDMQYRSYIFGGSSFTCHPAGRETFQGRPIRYVLSCTYHQLDSHNTHFVILIKAAMGACGSKAAEVETINRNQSNPTEPPTPVSCVVSGRG